MTDSVLREALELFQESEDGTSIDRNAAREDIDFGRLGNQWPQEILAQRQADGRPALTINRMPSFIRQVVNDARQNRPQITVIPVDDAADVATAEVIQGLVRSIERSGAGAAVAYDTALEHAVDGGFGFFAIDVDYIGADSFDMEVTIRRVADRFSVHWDPATMAFDASDWRFAFESSFLTPPEFKRRYPKADPVDFEDDHRDRPDWFDDDRVRVATYWRRDVKTRPVVLLSDGRVVQESALDSAVQIGPMQEIALRDALALQGIMPIRERQAEYHEVTRRVISGKEVLEEKVWPGSMIPIVPVWGEEVLYEGRRYYRSLIRDAKDAQRTFNYWRSATTELVALAPKAPFVGPKGFIPAGDEEKWRTANTVSHAFLEFEPGMPPQRQAFAGVPAGAIQEALNSADDMKSVIGIYDAALGARSNETSGRAILARQRESDTSTFHFIDNLNRSIQYAGRLIVELIPSVYSARQAIQIVGPDDEPKVISLVNDQGGAGKKYDLSIGRYDVAVKTGPSYTTQREATREVLIEIMRQVPDAAALLGDVVVKTMDFPDADQVAQRLKAMLPPQVAAAENAELAEGLPPEAQAIVAQAQQQAQQAQAQIQELQAQIQQVQAQLQAAGQDAEIKRLELQLRSQELQAKAAETQARVQIEQAQMQTDAALKSRELDIKEMEARTRDRVAATGEAEVAVKAADLDAQRQIEAARMMEPAPVAPPPAVDPAVQAPDPATMALAGALGSIAVAMERLSAPKRLVFDPATGRPVGSENAE